MNENEAWRRWRSRVYLWILLGGMAAIAIAGAWNVRRLARALPVEAGTGK